MAEVLGIIASAIALGQAAQATAKGTQWLASLRGATAEFCDLHNELITVVRHLKELESIRSILEDGALDLPPTGLAHLKSIGQGLEADVGKIKAIVYEFEAKAKPGSDGQRKIPKIKWGRERHRIVPLRDNVRKRRLELSDAMLLLQTTLNVGQSQVQHTMVVDIQTIRDVQLPVLEDTTHRVEELVTDLKSQMDQVSTTLSSDNARNDETTETLLKRSEAMAQALSRIEQTIQLMNTDANRGAISQSSDLQSDLGDLVERLETIESSLEQFGASEPLQNGTAHSTSSQIQGMSRLRQRTPTLRSSQLMHYTGPQSLARSDSQVLGWPEAPNNQLVMVQTTMNVGSEKKCPASCRCSCHEKNTVKSPGMLSKIIGSFFVSYNSIPVWKPRNCNSLKCKRGTQDNIQLSYMFPQWMLQRCLSLSLTWNSVLGSGASLHMSIPRISTCWQKTWRIIENRQIDLLRSLFASGEASPLDMNTDGTTLLMLCINIMNIEATKLVLSEYPKSMLTWRNEDGESAGLFARQTLLRTDLDDDSALLCQNTVDMIDEDFNTTIIIDAVLKRTDMSVEAAIALDPGALNRRDEHGFTAVYWAANRFDVVALEALLAHGADVHIKNYYGRTPLSFAAGAGYPYLVDRLIEAGSDLESRDNWGNTPILRAAWCNDANAVKQLLDAGASAVAHDAALRTALHLASEGNEWMRSSYDAMYLMCSSLTEHGLDINSRDDDGWTPLMVAIRGNNCGLALALYDLGADINVLDETDRTILHNAGVYARWDMINALRSMDLGTIDPNHEDDNGHVAENYMYGRISCPLTMLDADQTRPYDDEVELFEMWMAELREKWKRRNIRKVRVSYEELSLPRRMFRNPKATPKSWQRYKWRVPMKKMRRGKGIRCREVTLEVDFFWLGGKDDYDDATTASDVDELYEV